MKKKYLTREGHDKLADEYDHLFKVVRPEVVQRISDAAAEGDRSENAEYIYGRKRLRELDSRLRYLSSLFDDATVVNRDEIRSDVVCFGATVEVENEEGEIETWTIVGEGEAEAREHRVSWKAPVAIAMIGKVPGDVVTVKLPAGERELEILSFRFGDGEKIA